MSKLRGMANTRKRAPARNRRRNRPLAREHGPRGEERVPARARTTPRGRHGGRGIAGLDVCCRACRRSLPELDQRQRDVIGLGLIAVGIFMGFVLWGSLEAAHPGGRAGHGLAVGLGWAVGKARVLAPIALVGGGGALLLRPVWPALRPLRTGAICLSASITLALAAGTLGVSSGVSGGLIEGRVVDLGLPAGARRCRGRGALPGAHTGWCRAWAWTSSWSSCSWSG